MTLSQVALQKKRHKKKLNRKNNITKKNYDIKQWLHVPVLSRGSVHKCYITETIHDSGIGQVIITKNLPTTGKILMVAFIVDIYCLGVKNTLIRQDEEDDHVQILDALKESCNCSLLEVEPAYVKKLVLEAVAYADSLGIKPYHEYSQLKRVFVDIDATTCNTQFIFGKDGKPFLVQGPYDTIHQIKSWLLALHTTCGQDGFNYLLSVETL
jgi:hypothetical protein